MFQRFAAALAALGLWLAAPTAASFAATPYPGGVFNPSPVQYGMSVDAAVPIKVDDGVILKADIVYPTDPATGKRAPGPFPVILSQDIYSTGPATPLPPMFAAMANSPLAAVILPWKYYVPHGYIFVHLNVRGTGGSQGVMDLHGKRSGLDGVFVANWLANPANVPGSNGKIGLEGCSALGIVQLNTLAQMGELERLGKLDPKTNPIKASIAKCISGDGYHDLLFDNGVPTNVWYGLPPGPNPSGFNTPSLVAGREMAYHSAEFWTERDRVVRADDIVRTGTPILMEVGWKEAGFIGGFEMYAALQNAAAGRPHLASMAVDEPLSPKYQLVVGDWTHGGGLDRGLEEEWFATWLKGEDTGMQRTTAPIHVKELPSATDNRWVSLKTYPITDRAGQLFLSGHDLSPDAPAGAGSDKLVWAPGQSATYTLKKPFDRDMTLAGPAAVSVWVVSSRSDAQLFVLLNDVAPDGSVTPITHASMLASRRDLDDARSWKTADGVMIRPYLPNVADDPIKPGEPVKLDIPLQPAVWRLPAGHLLQLVLYTQTPQALCDADAKAVAPSALGCWWTTPMVRALSGSEYEVLQGPDHRSALNVPLVASDSLPTAQSGVTPTSMNVAMPLDWR